MNILIFVYLLDTQVSLAPTPVSPSVHNTFGYPFWDLTKRRDNIALAAMVAELVADMEVHMVADMELMLIVVTQRKYPGDYCILFKRK